MTTRTTKRPRPRPRPHPRPHLRQRRQLRSPDTPEAATYATTSALRLTGVFEPTCFASALAMPPPAAATAVDVALRPVRPVKACRKLVMCWSSFVSSW